MHNTCSDHRSWCRAITSVRSCHTMTRLITAHSIFLPDLKNPSGKSVNKYRNSLSVLNAEVATLATVEKNTTNCSTLRLRKNRMSWRRNNCRGFARDALAFAVCDVVSTAPPPSLVILPRSLKQLTNSNGLSRKLNEGTHPCHSRSTSGFGCAKRTLYRDTSIPRRFSAS